jgi:hypothetical protein
MEIAMKQHDITKICADSLRKSVNDNHGIKLGSSYAHELVAAYFGYKSRAALLADTKYPLSKLATAKIFVMSPDDFIDQRRKELEGLPQGLPDSYTLGEAVYVPLFSDEYWGASPYPPFKSFEKMAKYMLENDKRFHEASAIIRQEGAPLHHIFDMRVEDIGALMGVWHAHQLSDKKFHLVGKTLIRLPRVAGHIGYDKAHISFEMLHPSEQKIVTHLSEVSQ